MATASRRSVSRANKPKTGGFQLSQYKAKQSAEIKEFTVGFGGAGSITLKMDPSGMDLGYQSRVQDYAEKGNLGAMADEFFSHCIEWNLQDDEGNPLPIEPESWHQLPTQMFLELLEGMASIVNAPKTETSNA